MGLLRQITNSMGLTQPEGKPSPSAPPQNVKLAPLRMDNAQWTVGLAPKKDPTLAYESRKGGLGFRTDYGILREAVHKDGFVRGLLQQRQSAVIERGMFLRNAGNSDSALSCGAFVEGWLKVLHRETASRGGLMGRIREMLDAPPWGMYVGFLNWDWRYFSATAKAGQTYRRWWYVPVDIVQMDLDRCGTDKEGNFVLYAVLTAEQAAGYGFTPVPNATNWWYPHPLSIATFTPYCYPGDPAGWPILSTVYYGAWLLRNARWFHARFIERNTSPVATMSEDTQMSNAGTSEERTAAETALATIQYETGIKLPPGWEFKWHELMSNASPQAIEGFETYLRKEIASAIIGQTSTSISERSGSQSSAEVQERVAQGIISMDSLMLMAGMDNIINMVCDVNEGKLGTMPEDRPTWAIQIESAQNLEKRSTQLETAVANGVPVTVRQWMRELVIDEKIGDEPLCQVMPAAYAGAGTVGPPSQQPSNKSPARANQRAKKAPSTSQVQPRP